MKQTITLAQLEDLSREGKQKLRYWMLEHRYEMTAIEGEGCLYPAPFEWHPLPNIGQMIHFIDEHIGFDDDNGSYKVISWGGRYTDKELCDELWKYIKDYIKTITSGYKEVKQK